MFFCGEMTVGAKHSRNNVDKAVDRIKTRMQRRPDRLEAGDRLRQRNQELLILKRQWRSQN
ncbi:MULTISPECIES: hypothetical protein [Planktothricoides]|uniref:Transposase n=2 Tax=Planktothricoides raciborskii TaxID=132608 RepID=A0AAU8JAW5_9CYAN|nr:MULTISPECIES: hypothetical protein [Planktothricoides]MBD2542835.1 hypothetical protein [Planktothricoides raciborskii FACHB-1370]MBD2581418.1 hypothetical protein [Planktothricoides raciborskii FACHB-1261]